MRVFDAVVVGAGPAGAMAARDPRRRGAPVALVDGSHPREKPCGGGVAGPALGLVPAGAEGEGPGPAEMHAVTDRWLDGYAPAAGGTRRRYAWPIPSLAARDVEAEEPAGDGWMLLGDAAGLVDPITREGIFFALRSGMLAAQALGTPSPERVYAGAVRDELHDELRRAARLKAGFYRPRFTRLLIDALDQSPAIQR